MAGLVEVEGVDADYVTAPLEEIFAQAFDDQAFDVTELSFSNYLYLTSTGDCPYVGLPVFPSRAFRHSAIYIRTDRGIRGPRDLAGRMVGVREYSMTAALVARGVLEDDFGLRAAEVRWRYGPADAGDSAPIVRVRPDGVELAPLASGANLSDALRDGVLDALVAYKPPPAFLDSVIKLGTWGVRSPPELGVEDGPPRTLDLLRLFDLDFLSAIDLGGSCGCLRLIKCADAV